MATAEVTVMGGGIFGLAIAYACARRGASVLLIERHQIGAGASGGLVGALAPHVPENWNDKKAFQLDSLLMAADFWSGVLDVSGVEPGFARHGRLQPLHDEAAVAQAQRRAEEARHLWRGQAEWRLVQGSDSWRGDSRTGLWVHDTLSARLHPQNAARALVGAIRQLGGEVRELQEPRADGDPKQASARPIDDRPGDDRQHDGAVIWATGVAGLAALSSDLGQPVGSGIKGQAARFACRAADRPQLFVDGLHIVPHADRSVAVGSTSERVWHDPDSTDDLLNTLIERARSACPMLARAPVTGRWAGLRPRAASRAPVLGAWPGRAGHFIANGGFKIGFGMAPKVAEVMADLVLDGLDRIPAGFRVEDCIPGR